MSNATVMKGISEALEMEDLVLVPDRNELVIIDGPEDEDDIVEDEESTDPRLEQDFNSARKDIKDAASKGVDSLTTLQLIAGGGEDPKAYMALADMIRAVTTANQALIDLHIRKKKVQAPAVSSSKQVAVAAEQPKPAVAQQTNNVFVGSADDLDRFLASRAGNS